MNKIIVVKNDEKRTIGVEFNGVYYERGENQGLTEFIESVPNLYENFSEENIKVKPLHKRSSAKIETSKTEMQISKQEAIKKFGADAVKKAEEEARKNTYVDTDGDGKKDTQIDEANKQQEVQKQFLSGKAKGYEKGHQAGRQDGFNGKSKNTSVPSGDSVLNDSSKSEVYKKGYREGYKEGYLAGYANGVKQKQELEKVEMQKPKKVVSVESKGNIYTSEMQEKAKERS